LRKLLVIGATSVLYRAGGHKDALRHRDTGLLKRKGRFKDPFKLTAVALADKLARICWAVLRSRQAFSAKGAVMAA
jgi:transposase